MKLFVLDEEFPWPLNTGKRIRSFNLLQRLAAKHELYYFAFGRKESESYAALDEAKMNPIPIGGGIAVKSGAGFYLKLLMNLFDRRPYIVSSHYSQLFQSKLNQLTTVVKPDLIICEWTPYAAYLQHNNITPSVIVAHNIESTIWRRYYENEANPLKRWYIGKQADKVARFESEAFNWVDGFTAVSEEERAKLAEYSRSTRSEVIDNGVDLDFFAPVDVEPSPTELVFTGSMDWRPNQDAAVYFADELFPLLKQEQPAIKATFVGRNPPEHIVRLGQIDGITITGTVDDVRPYISKAAVYIVPLRIGGGSRLKILEALAMKKAVVSTSVGAEGLETNPGQDILIADGAQSFADQILKLLNDRHQQIMLGDAGRKLVERRYGWNSLADKLDHFLHGLVTEP